MNKPILLTKYDLLERVEITSKKIDDIYLTKDNWSNQIIREGMFSILVSSFEILLNDLLSMVLREIPGKLPKKEMLFTKEEIINNDLVTRLVDKYLIGVNYKSLSSFVSEFKKTLGITLRSWNTNKDNVVEYKATRNLLLHNDLFLNSEYQSKSGPDNRAKDWDRMNPKRLDIPNKYFEEAINTFRILVVDIKSEISTKFQKQTRIKIFKGVWEYLFESPIIGFHNWIEVDAVHDRILGWKQDNEWYGNLSDSEKMFIDFISENFFQTYPPNRGPNWRISYPMLRSLDSQRLSNLNFLISNSEKIFRILCKKRV